LLHCFLTSYTTTNQSIIYTTCNCDYTIEMHIECQKWVLAPNDVVVHVRKVVENIVPIPCLLIPMHDSIFRSLSQLLTTTTKKLQIKALQVWTNLQRLWTQILKKE
jgi:hypothetical protein